MSATAGNSGSRGPSAAERKALALLKVGWTSTMAEDLLDMCLNVFLKFGEATLPLLPEVLALHQVRTISCTTVPVAVACCAVVTRDAEKGGVGIFFACSGVVRASVRLALMIRRLFLYNPAFVQPLDICGLAPQIIFSSACLQRTMPPLPPLIYSRPRVC